MFHIGRLCGLQGIDPRENPKAIHAMRIFAATLVLLTIWILYQYNVVFIAKTAQVSVVIATMWFVWAFFIVEVVTMLALVNDKKRLILGNWFNAVIIIFGFPPAFLSGVMWIDFNDYRLLLLVRLITPTVYTIQNIIEENRIGATIVLAFLITIIFGEMLAIVEHEVIKTPWDGIWFAWETITTVGYGDFVPHTLRGRLLTIVLMIISVGLVAILTGNFTNIIFHKMAKREKYHESLHDRLNDLEAKLDLLIKKTDQSK